MERRSVLCWLVKKLRRRVPALVLLTVVGGCGALLGVAFALGSRGVIDSAVEGDRQQFLRACLLQGGIILGMLLCQLLSRHLKDRLNAELDRGWKRDLLHGLLHGEYAEVSAYHSGELLNRLNNDVRAVDEGLTNMLPGAVSMVARLAAAMAVLAALESRFALLIVGAGLFVVAATGLLRRPLKDLQKQVSRADGKVSGFLQETMEKLLMVQAMDVSDEMERRADRLLEERYQLQRRRKNAGLLAGSSVSLLSLGAGFAALVWCAAGLLDGRMTFGSLTAVTQLVAQLRGPFVNLSGILPQYISMTAAAERLMELDQLRGEPAESGEAAALYGGLTALGAEQLCFTYDRDTILRDVSFTLPKGSFTVVTGPSGVGKSTLLKLMLGVFRPDSGSLHGEQNGRRVPLDRSTRKLFAYVPQGNLLLSGTLRENLTITNPGASEEAIRQAVYVSGMDAYLQQLPQGLDTPLGESGAGLSEGQAQRLAIARAVLSGAPVLLLDEITSALDAETEQLVLERLRGLPDKTCIAVTHRPAALALADWRLDVSAQGVSVERLCS